MPAPTQMNPCHADTSNTSVAALALPKEVGRDLRTDHAGETGAVYIYLGILRVSRDAALRNFAQRHIATERKHLAQIEAWLPSANYSRLLPAWRIAGWLTGALPSLVGPRAVYATIEAVERFVDEHYSKQLPRLATLPQLHALYLTVLSCQSDEISHRDEAAAACGNGARGILLRVWCQLIDFGSRTAVVVSSRI